MYSVLLYSVWGWLSCWSFKYVFYTWVKRCNYIFARSNLSYANWFLKFFSVTDLALSSWARLFLNTELSFGCGQIFTKHSTANFLLNLPVKESRNWSHLANYYRHRHYYHIVRWNCCMTPEWPHCMALLHRLADVWSNLMEPFGERFQLW